MARLFGTDGIRGVAGGELDSPLAMKVGAALGKALLPYGKKVILGRDTRLSSDMLSAAIGAGLCSVGIDVIDLGICTTPAVAYLVVREGAGGGVMISASHNPYEYNGIKVFGPDGMKLQDSKEDKIEEDVLYGNIKGNTGEHIGRIHPSPSLLNSYVEHLSSAFGISLSGMRIAVDCANGSASITAEKLFSALGAECIMLGCSPNGTNINDSCGSCALSSIKWAVREGTCDMGVAFDGDGDRCIAIDRYGREVDGDYIMSILALKLKCEGHLAKNALVGTVMSNIGLKKFCAENGIDFVETRVGDRYVLEEMNAQGYSFGGEQSGHLIFRNISTTGDGQLSALALLSHVKESGKSLDSLATVMKKYPQIIINLYADAEAKVRLTKERLRPIICKAEAELENKGRILVRPSGTEPKIRVMVECEDEEIARSVAREAADEIKEILS